jgi:type I restriction enzyme R subunit
MKFTEGKLEKVFTELLGQEGFPHHLGIKITQAAPINNCALALI